MTANGPVFEPGGPQADSGGLPVETGAPRFDSGTPRVDPTYDLATSQYRAPVAEARRGFWSRFWFLIPLVALLIALPFILRACDPDRGEELAASIQPSTCGQGLIRVEW